MQGDYIEFLRPLKVFQLDYRVHIKICLVFPDRNGRLQCYKCFVSVAEHFCHTVSEPGKTLPERLSSYCIHKFYVL